MFYIANLWLGEQPYYRKDPLQSPVRSAVYARNVVLGTGVVGAWHAKPVCPPGETQVIVGVWHAKPTNCK